MRTMLRESATRRVNDWGSAMRKGCESRDNPRGHTPRGGGILATPATPAEPWVRDPGRVFSFRRQKRLGAEEKGCASRKVLGR